jgi:hypothetical protein
MWRARSPVLAPVTAVLLLAGCGGDDTAGGGAAEVGAGASGGGNTSLCEALSEQQVGEIVRQRLKPPVIEPDGSACRYLPVEVRDGTEIVVTLRAWAEGNASRVRRAVLVPEIGPEAVLGNNGSRGTAVTQFPHGDRVIEVSLGATGFEPTEELLSRSAALGTAIAGRLGAARPVAQEPGPKGVVAGRAMCSAVTVADVNAALGIQAVSAEPLVRSLEEEMCTYRTADGARPYSEVTISVAEPQAAGEPGDGEAVPDLGPGAAAGTYPLGVWAQFPTADDKIVELTWSSRDARSPEAQKTLTTLAAQVRDGL